MNKINENVTKSERRNALYKRDYEKSTPNSNFRELLCKRKFCFIISNGRSGSTSLLNMVNELPGYSLSGEHAGQFIAWYDLYKRFLSTQRRDPYKDDKTEVTKKENLMMYRSAWEHQKIHDIEFFEMMQTWYFKHTGRPGTDSSRNVDDCERRQG